MSGVRSLAVGLCVALGATSFAPSVAAQPPPTDPPVPTTTIAPEVPGSTPTTVPTTGPDGLPLPVDPNAPTTVPDPLATSTEELSTGAYGGQLPFDLASMAVLGGEVSRERARLKKATKRLAEAQTKVEATIGEFQRLAGQIEVIGVDREDKVADATAAKASMRRRAVGAYIRGDRSTKLISALDDPAEFSRGRRYLQALAELDLAAFQTYRARISEMDEAERALVDDQSALQLAVEALSAERDTATQEVLNAQRCVTAFSLASHACVDGFRLPITGPINFYDSWGAARMPFTVDQHWHEGTDIMAPMGREVVAVEGGTLFKIGDEGLGGLRLWLHGDSGIDYYYAHFSAFAPVAVEGARVLPGDVVGYVGNTGNAAGGPPHIHFEIHPAGGAPINPFPLLKATWGDRPMPLQSTVIEGIPSALSSLPPEER